MTSLVASLPIVPLMELLRRGRWLIGLGLALLAAWAVIFLLTCPGSLQNH